MPMPGFQLRALHVPKIGSQALRNKLLQKHMFPASLNSIEPNKRSVAGYLGEKKHFLLGLTECLRAVSNAKFETQRRKEA